MAEAETGRLRPGDGPAVRCGMAEFRRVNVHRCETAFHCVDAWSPSDWATAAAGELGEACHLIKKLRRGEDIPKIDLARELADTVTYLDLLAARLKIDLGAAMVAKFNEVSTRVNSPARFEEGG